MNKAKFTALAQYLHLGTDPKNAKSIKQLSDCVWEYGNQEFMVGTDEEADEHAKEYILDTVWAFNADFIIEHSSALDFDEASEKVVKAIAEQYESGNEAMKKLIDDLDEFVEDAISADGRGHFLAGYDGEENVETVNGTDYYIYRIN